MSDGVAVIIGLLLDGDAVTDLVPADRIAAGIVPEETPLPAISVTSVSKIDHNLLSPGATRHVDERVQVSVMADSYPMLKSVLHAVRAACCDFVGAKAGLSGVTVLSANGGPDYTDEQASIAAGSQDFMVGYLETR